MVADKDEECTPATVEAARDLIGDMVTNYQTFDGDHGFFFGNNDESFIEKVIA